MSDFVIGQKVKVIDEGENLKKGTITQIKDIIHGYVFVEIIDGINDEGGWFSSRFKTIVQDINDVVVGMSLTIKESERIYFQEYYEGQKIIVTEIDSEGFICDDVNIFSIKDFEEYEPIKDDKKFMEKEYEVVRKFRLLEIWESFNQDWPEFQKQFSKLLKEVTKKGRNIKIYWDSWEAIKKSDVLMKNLEHLEGKGFIREKEKDVVLKPGMKLYEKNDEHSYNIMDCGEEGMMLYVIENNFVFGKGDFRIPDGTTLSELNKKAINMDDSVCYAFEVVDCES